MRRVVRLAGFVLLVVSLIGARASATEPSPPPRLYHASVPLPANALFESFVHLLLRELPETLAQRAVLDAASCQAAMAEAHRLVASADGAAPAESQDLRAGLRAVGLSDYLIRGALVRAASVEELATALTPKLADWIAEGYTRLGLGVAPTGEEPNPSFVAVLVALDRVAQLNPFPRRHDQAARLALEGRLLRRPRALEIGVTPPQGAVTRERVLLMPSGIFSVSLTLAQPGIYQVEFLADFGEGARLVNWFDLEVGPTKAQAPGLLVRPPAPRNEAEATARVLAFTNAHRRARKLPPLALSTRLSEIERKVVAELAPDKALIHRDAQGFAPEARLKAAGLDFLAYGENLARHRDLEALLASLSDSPAHRQNLDNPLYTELGIGAVRQDAQGEWVVGQLFLLPDAPPSVAVLPGALAIPLDTYAKIHERRFLAGAPPIAISRQLSQAAEKALAKSLNHGALNLRACRDQLAQSLAQNPNTQSVRAVIALTNSDLDDLAAFAGFENPSWRVTGFATLKQKNGGLASLILFGDGAIIE